MKRLFSILGLVLAISANANVATNYQSFSLKFIPEMSLSPGPHSDLPFPPSWLGLSYDTDEGIFAESMTNNSAVYDFSGDIASHTFYLSESQPLWNAIEAGETNPVVFGRIELEGYTIMTNHFSFTNTLFSLANYKHMMSWQIDYIISGYGESEVLSRFLGGSPFSGEAQAIWDEHMRNITGQEQNTFFPVEWRDQLNINSGDVTPGFQDYYKTGKLLPLYKPMIGLPANFSDTSDTNIVTWTTNGNSGAEGIIFTTLVATNNWEVFRTALPLPLSNGDTNPPAH